MTGCQLYASDARGAGARNSRLLLVHATSGNGPLLHLPARAARHTHGREREGATTTTTITAATATPASTEHLATERATTAGT